MNKKELLKEMNKKGIINADEVLNDLSAIIENELKKNGKFRFPNLGTFKVQDRPARVVYSFGKRTEVSAQKVLKFKASAKIKRQLNAK